MNIFTYLSGSLNKDQPAPITITKHTRSDAAHVEAMCRCLSDACIEILVNTENNAIKNNVNHSFLHSSMMQSEINKNK